VRVTDLAEPPNGSVTTEPARAADNVVKLSERLGPVRRLLGPRNGATGWTSGR
jgi:hypothetical protein